MTDALAQLAAQGLYAKHIAKVLGCSASTVRRRAKAAGITITKAPNKFGAEKVYVEGEGWFDSGAEAKRWNINKLRQAMGEITHLRRQVPYSIDVEGQHICEMIVDFDYYEGNSHVVEDVKGRDRKQKRGTVTDLYRLKKKLLTALYRGVEFREIRM